MKIPDSDKITTTQAAELLGVNPSLVRRWVMNGDLDYERLGQNNFVSRKAIEAKQRERSRKKKHFDRKGMH